MYISVFDLGLSVLFLVAVAAGIYLIVFLRQAIGVVSRVKALLDEHEENIRDSLAMLPETLANINALATTMRETVTQTSSAVQVLQEDLVESFRDGLESFVVYMKVVGEIFRAIFSKVA